MRRLALVVALALALAPIPPATATDAAPAPPDRSALPKLGDGQMLTSGLGTSLVFDADGVEVGDVQDVIIDRAGAVAAILVGTGGVLGIRERPVAVRMEYVRIESTEDGGRRFMLDLTAAELDAAPRFEAPEG